MARTSVAAVDRLSIVAHDRFQEIVDEASRPESPIRLQQIVLDADELGARGKTVVSQPVLANELGIRPAQAGWSTEVAGGAVALVFATPAEQAVAQLAYGAIRALENQPDTVPSLDALRTPAVQAQVLERVREAYRPAQTELDGVAEAPDLAAVVARPTELVVRRTIQIPRILVVPRGEVRSGFHPFTLDVSALRYPAPSDELHLQYLRTGETDVVGLGRGGTEEARLEDYVVSGLVDFDDIAYDQHAGLLYDLAPQVIRHLRGYLSEDDARKVLRVHGRDIARHVRAQMQRHFWEDAAGYDVQVSKGFTELKPSAYAASADDTVLDYRQSPADRSNVAKYLFSGFARCLYPVQKFHSDAERRLAVILEREAEKWFRPAQGQFHLFYQHGADPAEYQPDFVAETAGHIYMIEPKMCSEMDDPEVRAKRDAAVQWCARATAYTTAHGGKPWSYLLVPHDDIAGNATLAGLAARFAER